MTLEAKIEGFLFYKAEPVSIKELSTAFSVSEEEVLQSIESLRISCEHRGIILMQIDSKVTLGTNPELSAMLEVIKKEELGKELSKASLETLAIVLYKNGVTRGDIDYIRGVNSSFILRALAVRDLVERVPHPTDSRMYVYKPTIELLRFLGVSRVEDLPEYETSLKVLSDAFSQVQTTEE